MRGRFLACPRCGTCELLRRYVAWMCRVPSGIPPMCAACCAGLSVIDLLGCSQSGASAWLQARRLALDISIQPISNLPAQRACLSKLPDGPWSGRIILTLVIYCRSGGRGVRLLLFELVSFAAAARHEGLPAGACSACFAACLLADCLYMAEQA